MRRFCLFCLPALIAAQSSFAQTPVSGNVTGTWSLSGSPYYVIDDCSVPTDSTLIIEPGVEVYFADYYEILVEGNIQAIGTETDSIIFTSLQSTPQADDWKYVKLYYSDLSCNFDYCIF